MATETLKYVDNHWKISNTPGESMQLAGFYSCGELAAFSDELISCQPYNQTMTPTQVHEE